MKKKKPDMLTILLYAIIVFAVLYVSAGLGAAMDLSVDDEGVLDFNVLMTQFETVLTSTDTVGAHFTDFSSYSFKITLMVTFALGIYALMKYTSRKRLHRKGVEHGSARWANEKEEKFLADRMSAGSKPKRGKYIAVKAPFAERYVRLNSLGDEYLPKMLERRISLNGTYVRKVRERMSRSSEVEKKICSVILDTTVAIQQFRIIPKKTKPQKIYTFSNDESLNLLVEQLSTIGEFGITSRDEIYAKAEELKNSVDEKTEELKALSNEAPTLKSEIAQIRFYFENVQNRRRLDSMGQVRLAAAKEVVDKHGIRSESEIAELEERLKLLPIYIRTVQDKLAEEQARLKRVNRLADVYECVIEGNYIENLVKEQKETELKKPRKK